MLLLSIDCAGHGCGVCVWKDGKVLSDASERMERGQDQRLMPLIVAAMKQAGVDFKQLDRIAVTRGPGSFTGLRIGLAAARGIGLAAGKPVIGIDRFSIYHEPFKSEGRDVLVVIDSRRKELFCRFYPASGKAGEPSMMTAEEIAVFVKDNPNIIVCGDAANALGFPSRLREGLGEGSLRNSDAGSIGTCAKLAAEADTDNPEFLPRPIYIRAPDVTFPKNAPPIQPLSPDQAPLLAELHAESFDGTSWSLQQIRDSLALATTRGWSVHEGNTAIGFILCQIIPDQSEVLTFCVRPSHRRRGAGQKLLHAAAEAAQAVGSDLHLETAADNAAALALYRKLGFNQTGLRPGYYRHGGLAVDAVLFTLAVSARTQ
jgi:tRNA threonylcarbamoyladenosine biosynthesis protein TsaB